MAVADRNTFAGKLTEIDAIEYMLHEKDDSLAPTAKLTLDDKEVVEIPL